MIDGRTFLNIRCDLEGGGAAAPTTRTLAPPPRTRSAASGSPNTLASAAGFTLPLVKKAPPSTTSSACSRRQTLSDTPRSSEPHFSEILMSDTSGSCELNFSGILMSCFAAQRCWSAAQFPDWGPSTDGQSLDEAWKCAGQPAHYRMTDPCWVNYRVRELALEQGTLVAAMLARHYGVQHPVQA